jgi:lysophospholipase L1-like esterase
VTRSSAGRALAAAAVTAGIVAAARTAWRYAQGRAIAARSRPFEAHPPTPGARLLVVGDSSGVGTGATNPSASVAGRLAAAAAGLSVDNRARDGARFSDVVAQLDGLDGERYDAVLVMAGGIDAIYFTRLAALRESVDRVLARASRLATTVVVVPSGNLGNAPFFLWPASILMRARTRAVHAVVRDLAVRHGASYVSLYRERRDDPFAQDPSRYHAADGLHPSDAGYALWFGEVERQSGLGASLAASPAA